MSGNVLFNSRQCRSNNVYQSVYTTSPLVLCEPTLTFDLAAWNARGGGGGEEEEQGVGGQTRYFHP